MRASFAQRLLSHLRQFSQSTGLPIDYVRKSPRKNAPHVVRFLPGSERGARRQWIQAERYARAVSGTNRYAKA